MAVAVTIVMLKVPVAEAPPWTKPLSISSWVKRCTPTHVVVWPEPRNGTMLSVYVGRQKTYPGGHEKTFGRSLALRREMDRFLFFLDTGNMFGNNMSVTAMFTRSSTLMLVT